ncbi:hypothetical protein JW865_04210 [Candidatus Bathyarchaeota archaeon]|nr:hypothetical protein [Candidatus Bathyarchaeota archaeon]
MVELNTNQKSFRTIRDVVFIGSSITFNILISMIYILSKIDQTAVRIIGIPIIFLIIPYTYTLNRFKKDNAGKQVIIPNIVIILYLLLELLLDYVLLIPFRDILLMHILYILVFYAAEFSIIGVSFRLNRRWGFVVLFTFFVLIGCLIFSYAI